MIARTAGLVVAIAAASPAWAVVGDPTFDPGGLFGGGGAAPTAIPGPAALGLLALGVAGLLAARRLHRRPE